MLNIFLLLFVLLSSNQVTPDRIFALIITACSNFFFKIWFIRKRPSCFYDPVHTYASFIRLVVECFRKR